MAEDGVVIPTDDCVAAAFAVLVRSPDAQATLAAWRDHPPAALDVLRLMRVVAEILAVADERVEELHRSERESAARVGTLRPELRWHVEDVMAYTGLSARSVQQYAPEMGGVRVGRRWRFGSADVKAWWTWQLMRRGRL